MINKGFMLASCAVFVISSAGAFAGPCDTGRADKDAGSGPTVGSAAPSAHAGAGTDQHPPTGRMGRAAGDTATSAEDAQKQMQGQPTAAQQAGGAKPSAQTADKDC
jgi:hypothetical protein